MKTTDSARALSFINDNLYYILDQNGEAIHAPDRFAWWKWFESSAKERRLSGDLENGLCISTVFLAINRNFSPGDPILWETAIGKNVDKIGEGWQIVERYSTRASALLGHRKWTKLVKKHGDRIFDRFLGDR